MNVGQEMGIEWYRGVYTKEWLWSCMEEYNNKDRMESWRKKTWYVCRSDGMLVQGVMRRRVPSPSTCLLESMLNLSIRTPNSHCSMARTTSLFSRWVLQCVVSSRLSGISVFTVTDRPLACYAVCHFVAFQIVVLKSRINLGVGLSVVVRDESMWDV